MKQLSHTHPTQPHLIGKTIGCLLVLLMMGLGSGFLSAQIHMISAELTTQKLEGGKTFAQKASLLYRANGDLVSHFHPPLEYVVLNNSKGNIRLYNPSKNEVRLLSEPYLGSNTTYFYFFVHRKMADLGLREYGFELTDSEFDAPYQVTWWTPPSALLKSLSKVKLVHKKGLIVYAGYHHPTAGLFKKVYYSGGDYQFGSFFPEKITTITYIEEGRDSIVERSIFTDLKVNDAANTTELNFEIPVDAQIRE